MTVLSYAVLGSALWAVLALAALRRWVKGFGPRQLFAAPAGDPALGVRYAFTAGLAPGAKESVGLHGPSYLAGLGLHAGLAAGLGHLALTLVALPRIGGLLVALRLVAGLGAACGLGLLAKRRLSPALRILNQPDDYLANGLCSLFLVLTLGTGFRPALQPWLQGAAILLFAYVPVGKLRHCLFFFTTRAHFGAFFGRRATFPPRS